jgi:hypothetical protein
MPVYFGKREINGTSAAYQQAFKTKVVAAIDEYVKWMSVNADDTRIFGGRFSHLLHGESGKLRAQMLRQAILTANEDFYSIVCKVGATLMQSSLTTHSLKRHVFQQLTAINVINELTHVADFETIAYQTIVDELDQYKTAAVQNTQDMLEALKKNSQDDSKTAKPVNAQTENVAVDLLASWSLINIVQELQIDRYADTNFERSFVGNFADFADTLLEVYAEKLVVYRRQNKLFEPGRLASAQP